MFEKIGKVAIYGIAAMGLSILSGICTLLQSKEMAAQKDELAALREVDATEETDEETED